MRCPQCRIENIAGRRFCAGCGAPLAQPCPACQFVNDADAQFCGGCGHPLAQRRDRAGSLAHSQPPSFLAAKILQSRHTLEGERKQVATPRRRARSAIPSSSA
jgi:hypothetical protein